MSKVINIDNYKIIKTNKGFAVYSPLYDDIISRGTKKHCEEEIEYNKRMSEKYLVEEDEAGLYIMHYTRGKEYCNCHPETCCCPNGGVSTTYHSNRHGVSGNVKVGDYIFVDIRSVKRNILVK